MRQWPRWRIRDKCALLGHWRGRDAECGFCAPWARAEGRGGARGLGCPLAAEPGLGQAAGRTWPSQQANRRAAASGGGAGAWPRPGGARGSGGDAPPPSKRPGRRARAEPSSQNQEGDKVRTGGPAPTTSWDPASSPQPPNWDWESDWTLRPQWFRSARNYSFRRVDGAGASESAGGSHPALGFFPGSPFPGFPQSVHRGWVGLVLGWSWAGAGSPLMFNLRHSSLCMEERQESPLCPPAFPERGAVRAGAGDLDKGGIPSAWRRPCPVPQRDKATKERLVGMRLTLVSRRGPLGNPPVPLFPGPEPRKGDQLGTKPAVVTLSLPA